MASALEQFVNNVRSLSSEGNFKELSTISAKYKDVLTRNSQHLDTVLETLDLQQHSIGILAVLTAKLINFNSTNIVHNVESFNPMLAQVEEFIVGCNGEQVRFTPEMYAELCHQFTNALISLEIPMQGINLLIKAIQKIQLHDSQLTAIHSDLCKLCLLTKCLRPALQFLDVDVTSISTEDDAKYFLLYFFYGGMVYTALKNYDRASYFFEVCVTTPASAISHITLEAYKKYILVSLILNGKIMPLPTYTCNLVKRHIKRLSLPYQELGSAYSTNSCDEVKSIMAKYNEVFRRDNNLGLIKQVLNSLYKKNIQRLTNTFLTLSLSDVAARVKLASPAEAEKYILNMIEDGEIFATINQIDGMVVFHDDPEKYNSPRMLAKLEKEMAECAELGKKVLEMEEEVVTTPQYIRRACGQNEQEDQAAGPAQPTVSNASGPKLNTYSM